jgi:hypothetical protein
MPDLSGLWSFKDTIIGDPLVLRLLPKAVSDLLITYLDRMDGNAWTFQLGWGFGY